MALTKVTGEGVGSLDSLGIGTASPDGLLTLATANSSTPRFRLQHPTNNADATIDTYYDGSGTYLTIGTNVYQESNAALTKFDSAKGSGLTYYDSSGIILFYNGAAGSSITEKMRIDSAGRVTKPYQPHFQVRSNAGNNASTWEAGQVVKFQIADTNQGSHYSTSTGRFTAPVAGFYQFNFTGFGYDGGVVGTTLIAVALRKNGTNYIMLVYDQNAVSGTTYPSSTGSASVYLSVNDYVEIYVDSGGIYADGSYLYASFSGFLVG